MEIVLPENSAEGKQLGRRPVGEDRGFSRKEEETMRAHGKVFFNHKKKSYCLESGKTKVLLLHEGTMQPLTT